MKKIGIIILVIFLLILGSYLFFSEEENLTDKSEDIAREWIIKNSPTYMFDGSGLELVDQDNNDFIFEFVSSQGGYGDRTNQIVTQVITPHRIVVTVKNGEIVSAITDNIFSEIKGRIITEENLVDDDSVVLPVYFGKFDNGEELFPVSRTITEDNTALSILEELIKGPTESETQSGYYSAINPDTRINSTRVEGKTVYVDLSSELEKGVAGSATVFFIRNQIEKTILGMPFGVEKVIISIDGETEDILQP